MQSIVVVGAERAETDAVNLEAVIGGSQALSIHAPLTCSTLDTKDTVASEVEEVASAALVTVANHKVEGVAVKVGSNARTEA